MAPPVLVVRALLARDEGLPEVASTLLRAAADRLKTPLLAAAAAKPPSDWPPTFRALMEGRTPAPKAGS
jgi:hypothetical protein